MGAFFLRKKGLGVSTPALSGPVQQCTFNVFSYNTFGGHLQMCQPKSVASQVHDWVVYKMGTILGSVGHRVKIHKITPGTGKERGDIAKTSSTGQPSSSSSHSDHGFHDDTC